MNMFPGKMPVDFSKGGRFVESWATRAWEFLLVEVRAFAAGGIARALFAAVVIVPTFLSIVICGFWMSDRYVSQTLMTVRGTESQIASMFGGMLGSLGGHTGMVDGYVVEEYIKSSEIVTKLQDRVDLVSIYTVAEADSWSRLSSSPGFDELHQYYLDHVEVYFDSTANVIHLDVQAFRPEHAQKIAQAVTEISDDMVDRISLKSRSDAVKFAGAEVGVAEERLRKARLALYDFRNKHGELDPVRSAEAIGGIVSSLEGELSRYRTELASMRSYMREESAQIAGVKARIAAIQQQIAAERGRLTDGGGSEQTTSYSDLLAEYEKMLIEEEFAKSAYSSAVSALEIARADAGRKQAYLVAFVEPSMPDEPSKPERLLTIGAFAVCGLLAYGILMLIGAAIREHART
ncbi:MAG: hypothetical protein RH982_11050 [Parvibaculum sp.]